MVSRLGTQRIETAYGTQTHKQNNIQQLTFDFRIRPVQLVCANEEGFVAKNYF